MSSPLLEVGPRGPGSPELKVGDVLTGRYTIRKLIGQGGVGRVYLADDALLSRPVAIKVVRVDRIGGDQLKLLRREAEVTALFNHPNIVTIHDLGTHHDAPFLALEYVDGGNLTDRLRSGPLPLTQVLRLGSTLAGAVAYAHRQGVLHRDLKPQNILLPPDGRVRILDFGLAVTRPVESGSQFAGTLPYMSPEQFRGDRLTTAIDVWGLGSILYELVTGSQAYPHGCGYSPPAAPPVFTGIVGIPTTLASLLDRTLAWAPEQRPSADELARALDDAFVVGSLEPQAFEESPYRGLLAFDEASADRFFGRERDVENLVERLAHEAAIGVVGPSGVGKSSLVHAGLVPALKAREGVVVVSLRPGRQPFQALARVLVVAAARMGQTEDEEGLLEQLRVDRSSCRQYLRRLADRFGRRVLLVVDQLEELFTHVGDLEERRDFLQIVIGAAREPLDPVRVIVTLRDDFVGRVSALERVFVVAPLEPAQVLRALKEPLRRTGYRFDDAEVIERLVVQTSDDLGALPLLQFACSLLWDARDRERRTLPARAFDTSGGIGRVLASHGDRLLDGLSTSEVGDVRRFLLALVSAEKTRISLPVEVARAELGAQVDEVGTRLVDARLVVLRRTRPNGQPAYELAHESLITRWDRLRQWLEELEADRVALERLRRVARAWNERGGREDAAANATELADVRRLGALLGPLPADLLDFARAGERSLSRARRRRLVGWIGTIVGLVVVAVSALALAREARLRQLAAEAQTRALQLASANMGQFDLELMPFDWGGPGPVPVSAAALPLLSWTLLTVAPHGRAPGEPLGPTQLRRQGRTVGPGGELVERVEAVGVPAFLRVDGRGRAGGECGPAWVRVASLPGYSDRETGAVRKLRFPVPTCQATEVGMLKVPGGDFLDGGAVAGVARILGGRPETKKFVPTFFLDRTEVSNAQYRVFSVLSAVTGLDPPQFPTSGLLSESGLPDHPVTSVDAFSAELMCRFFGKRLPTNDEWSKAARGGLLLDPIGMVPNPVPRRPLPWGTETVVGRANLERERIELKATMAVDTMPQGAGPYGHLHLAGNVREWTAEAAPPAPLRKVRGGGWSSPVEAMEHLVVAENEREPRYFDFSIGFRCATSTVPEEGAWSRERSDREP